MEPKTTKKECGYCHGLGFHVGREPEEGEPFRIDCARCNGFGIMLRRDAGKWERIKSFLEAIQVEP